MRHGLLYFVLFLSLLVFLVGLYRGGLHLARLKPDSIKLHDLPGALALSFFRMTASYVACLVFAYALGLLAALSKTGERVIIPVLDILQSVPVVGFFPAAISFFIGISQGHRIGVELACTFLIFTAQAWNMAFAVYEATKTIPQDNLDAIASFGVNGSLRFWKLLAPASVPRLVYNSILSWSNGWYFLVACEIIAVGNVRYDLPGIGSFLAQAAEQDQMHLVLAGLAALTTLILGLDVLVWRPASVWSERFRQDYSAGAPQLRAPRMSQGRVPRKIMQWLRPVRHALLRMLKILTLPITWLLREVVLPLLWDLPLAVGFALARPALGHLRGLLERAKWINLATLWMLGASMGMAAGRLLVRWFSPPWPELAREIPLAILASTGRIVLGLAISIAWILPVVLFTWDRPRLRQALTTVAQIGASLPAVALFPLIVLVAVKRFGGGMEIASIALLLTGMQWYILFNCLGGTAIIPSDLAEASRALGLTRLQTWRHLVLPAIRPALITGAITAWGGGWNALVVSEYVAYKENVLTVRGIGALLNRAVYQLGDNRSITLCIAAMIAWIIVLNAIIWRPLYQSAADRYKFDA